MSATTNFKNKLLAAGGSLLLLAVFFAASAFNKKKFSTPNGNYSVGIFHLELNDLSRSGRVLPVSIYYPTELNHSETTPYHPNPELLEEDLSSLYGIPKVLIKKISRSNIPVKLLAKPNTQDREFPILIFSHGFNGSRFQNSFLLPQLVSQGYIVVSIEHSSASSGTIFKNGKRGTIVPFDKLMANEEFSNQEINDWSQDQIFVFEELKKLAKNRSYPYLSAANFDKVGVFGHSFGGATSAVTLTKDIRFKAGINLDGFYFGNAYLNGFEQPFMEIRSDNKSASEITEKELQEFKMSKSAYQNFMFDEWNKRIQRYAKNGYESFVILHSNHMSFSDFTLMMPFSFITAPHREAHHELTTSLILSFFDQHLKSKERKSLSIEMKKYLK